MGKLDFIYARHSVRRFKDEVIPRSDLEEMLKAAVLAPSGKNEQNWHFVVVEDRKKIKEISDTIENKVRDLAHRTQSESIHADMIGMIPYYVANLDTAPVVILAFAGPYPSVGPELLAEGTINPEEAVKLSRFAPGVQNVAAAMENLLLAAAALGYGGCWMTGPMYAADEIQQVVGFNKPGYFLVTMTPLGVPSQPGKNPPRKPLEEVVTFI